MTVPVRRAASESVGGDYSAQDVAETCAHITDLLSECADLTRRYAPDGRWEPSSPDGATTRTEAAELLASMSRLLARTRHDLRKVDARIRQRAYDSDPSTAAAARR